jgi:outer membrane lipoprotein-sorting protein
MVQFQNIQTNATLPASLFTFKPSAKIDVIDETKK